MQQCRRAGDVIGDQRHGADRQIVPVPLMLIHVKVRDRAGAARLVHDVGRHRDHAPLLNDPLDNAGVGVDGAARTRADDDFDVLLRLPRLRLHGQPGRNEQ